MLWGLNDGIFFYTASWFLLPIHISSVLRTAATQNFTALYHNIELASKAYFEERGTRSLVDSVGRDKAYQGAQG